MRRVVAERLGLHFDPSRDGFLSEVIAGRASEHRLDATAYVTWLEKGGSGSEINALARALTVGETYFFRHLDQLQALSDVALPERRAARGNAQRLRILSAGCASGEEAYSIAILARKCGLEPAPDIIGVDINSDALQRAVLARYSPWSLRATPAQVRDDFFTPAGKELLLDASLRAAVSFVHDNLTDPSSEVFAPGSFDVILCRNVLMYFTPDHARRVVKRLARALVPGGFLFLGHAETLRGLSRDFQLRHAHNAFFYQLGRSDERLLDGVAAAAHPPAVTSPAGEANQDFSATWLEVVERSSRRIELLTRLRSEPPPATSEPERSADALGRSLELLRRERFAEALQVLEQGQALDAEPSAHLVRAALLAQLGDTTEAELACRALRGRGTLEAGACYVLALCLERRGQMVAAVEHLAMAAQLDAEFAMPHLHWGLMARRNGDSATAVRELREALQLLPGEEAMQLLLFGGGFGRDALIALCRSELAKLGATT